MKRMFIVIVMSGCAASKPVPPPQQAAIWEFEAYVSVVNDEVARGAINKTTAQRMIEIKRNQLRAKYQLSAEPEVK